MELHIKPSNESIKELYTGHLEAYEGDAGIDCFFPETTVIKSRTTKLVDLGIACEMLSISKVFTTSANSPSLYKNKSFFILPRSSIYKTPIRLANSIGLIDSKYRGNLMVALDNMSESDFTIKKGTKLFQIVCSDLEPFKIVIVDKLSDTARGSSGFGSSGK